MRFDTLRNRLVLLIFAITAAAIGFIYLYVVPQLESSLTAEKLRRLERLGDEQGPRLARALQTRAPEEAGANLVQMHRADDRERVTLLAVRDESGTPAHLRDCRLPGRVDRDPGGLPPPSRLPRGHVTSGVETVADGESASSVPIEACRPDGVGGGALQPLAEVEDNVALIRRQILIAGAIALVGASLAGFWARVPPRGGSAACERPSRSPRATLAGRSRSIPRTSSASSPAPSTRCSDISPVSTAPARSSSPTPRTSCAPRSSLGGFVELLETENLSAAERRAFVAEMRSQIERLQKLTANLLDLCWTPT